MPDTNPMGFILLHKLFPRLWVRPAVAILFLICMTAAFPTPVLARDFALTLYGGVVTDGDFEDAFSPNVKFRNGYLVDAALAWTASRFWEGAFSLELEGQVAKYFGDQDNWEFNAPIVVGRWSKFPWNRRVDTSIAWGIGPSYSTQESPIEKDTHSSTDRLLVYWFAEVALGPPESKWAFVVRLHHRSTGFGTVAENGGSNTWAAGVKFRF
jgi:hypothetical protein